MAGLVLHRVESQETMDFSTTELDFLFWNIICFTQSPVLLFTYAVLEANFLDSKHHYGVNFFLEAIIRGKVDLVDVHASPPGPLDGVQCDLPCSKRRCTNLFSMGQGDETSSGTEVHVNPRWKTFSFQVPDLGVDN